MRQCKKLNRNFIFRPGNSREVHIMTATLPEIDQPHMIEADLIEIITTIMADHPRSLQTAIGPSEIGNPCSRALVHKLAGHSEPGDGDRWLATIGTAVHGYLEGGIRAADTNSRFLLEERVMVGSAAGQDIWGHADLFDTYTGCVVDWKCVSPTNLLAYKTKGPGAQYRTQAHLYGRGFALAGHHVQTVMIAFLPRNGRLGTAELNWPGKDFVRPGDRYFWSEPYDESVALAGLSRLNGLYELLQLLGPEALLETFPACKRSFCPWCSTWRW